MNTHVSSGGIVYRWRHGQRDILVLYRAQTGTYHLPKGTQESGESLEDAAVREIYEETGYVVSLEHHVVSVPSSFERDGVRIQKQTHYFSARAISDHGGTHDAEHDTVTFLSYEEALSRLSVAGGHRLGYEDERAVLVAFAHAHNRSA